MNLSYILFNNDSARIQTKGSIWKGRKMIVGVHVETVWKRTKPFQHSEWLPTLHSDKGLRIEHRFLLCFSLDLKKIFRKFLQCLKVLGWKLAPMGLVTDSFINEGFVKSSWQLRKFNESLDVYLIPSPSSLKLQFCIRR